MHKLQIALLFFSLGCSERMKVLNAQEVRIIHQSDLTIDVNDFCLGVPCIWEDIDEIIEIVPKQENLLVFEDIADTHFTMMGQHLGETLVTIVGKDDDNNVHQYYLKVSIENISTLHASWICSANIGDAETFLVPTDTEIDFFYAIDRNQTTNWNRPLQGNIDIEFDGLILLEHDHDSRTAQLLTPSFPSQHQVTSPVWPDLLTEVEVYQEGDVDALVLFWTGPETAKIGHPNWVSTTLYNDGRPICIDSEIRGLTVQTPDICDLDGAGTISEETDNSGFIVHGLASGECRIQVDISTAGLSETLVVTVEE